MLGSASFKKVIVQIPSNQPMSLEKETFPKLVLEQKVMSVTFEEKFIDIGTPSSYQQARQFFT